MSSWTITESHHLELAKHDVEISGDSRKDADRSIN